jgi:hypothetical protein
MKNSSKLNFDTARKIIGHRLARLEKDGADPAELPAQIVKLGVALALEINGPEDTLAGLSTMLAQLADGFTGYTLADLAPVGNA